MTAVRIPRVFVIPTQVGIQEHGSPIESGMTRPRIRDQVGDDTDTDPLPFCHSHERQMQLPSLKNHGVFR